MVCRVPDKVMNSDLQKLNEWEALAGEHPPPSRVNLVEILPKQNI